MFFYLCLLVLSRYTHAQVEVDSTHVAILRLCQKAEQELFENKELSLSYIEELRMLHDLDKNDPPYHYLWEELAITYQFLKEYDTATKLLEKVVEVSRVEKDSIAMGIALTHLGRDNIRTSSWSKSIKHHLKALAINKRVNEPLTAENLRWVAIAYLNQDKAKEATALLKEATIINKKYKNHHGLFWSYFNLANVFTACKEYDSAIRYAHLAKTLGEEIYNDTMVVDASILLVEIYLNSSDMDLAEDYLKALASYLVSENALNYIYVRYLMAQVFYQKGLIDENIIQIAKETFFHVKRFSYPAYQMLKHEELGKRNQVDNDHILAFVPTLQFNELKKYLIAELNQRQRLTLEEQYEIQRRENQIIFLERKNEREQNRAQVAHLTWNIVIIAFCMLIAVLLIVTYYRYTYNRKQLATIRTQKAEIEGHIKEKDLLMSELQHRTKNNLIMIRSLLKNQANRATNPETKSVFNESTFQVSAVTLVYEQLNLSDGFQSINCRQYFNQLTALYKKANTQGKGIFLDAYIDDIELSVHLLVPLGLIANEAITNSIKHAFQDGQVSNPKINLRLCRKTDKTIFFEVCDNGHWKGAHKNGKGLGLIEGLGRQLNAEVSFDRANGTKLTVIFQEGNLEEELKIRPLAS